MGRLFGTDGVRGVANQELTPELAFQLEGPAPMSWWETGSGGREWPIIVGRDTRVSGAMLEAALVAGITSTGVQVELLG